jgi:hypothetical protein
MTANLSALASAWLNAKDIEAKAIAHRREIEDKMKSLIGVPDALDGTETVKPDGYVIKVTGRINRKINADKLQELASEAGLTEHLSSLFRWKPEINMAIWKSSDPAITTPLLGAITSEPGRASFAITVGE